MSKMFKRLTIVSVVVAILVGLAAAADMIMGVPFAGQMTLDIMLLLAAGVIGYMGFEVYREAS